MATSQRNERCQRYAWDWVRWLNTRRFYGQPPQVGIIAGLMARVPGRVDDAEPLECYRPPSGEPPDAKNSPEIAAFHTAVLSVESTNPEMIQAWLRIYLDVPTLPSSQASLRRGIAPRAVPIKTLSNHAGISIPTYYSRAHRAAGAILGRMSLLLTMQNHKASGL